MTAYTKTIENTVDILGPGPTSLWNAYNWNAFLWGAGTEDLPTTAYHELDNGGLTPDSSTILMTTKVISELVTPSSDPVSEQLFDSHGWNHVFLGQTIEGEDREFTSWGSDTRDSETWTTVTPATTTWSDA